MSDINADAAWEAWRDKAQALLASNRVEVGDYRFTRPAPAIYEHQWL